MDQQIRTARSFKTRYANEPPTVQMIERGPEEDAREPYVSLISSDSWAEVVHAVILDYVGDIRKQLLRRPNLPENERNRLNGSLLTIEFLLDQIYKRAGENMPEKIRAAFR